MVDEAAKTSQDADALGENKEEILSVKQAGVGFKGAMKKAPGEPDITADEHGIPSMTFNGIDGEFDENEKKLFTEGHKDRKILSHSQLVDDGNGNMVLVGPTETNMPEAKEDIKKNSPQLKESSEVKKEEVKKPKSDSDPVLAIIHTSKKQKESLEIKIEVDLLSKDIFNLIVNNFDGENLDKKVFNTLLDSIKTETIKSKILSAIEKHYGSKQET